MQNTTRFDIMSFVADRQVLVLYERRKKAIIKRRIMNLSKLAACLVFAVALIVAIRYITGPSSYKNDFVIRDGELLSYTGTDTEVIIPDEVHTIGGKAFIQCSGVGNITSISIGPAVEKIAEDAFEGMTSLREIKVSEDNGHFIFHDGILVATDGSICFTIATNFELMMSSMVEAVYSILGKDSFVVTHIKYANSGTAVVIRFGEERKEVDEIRIDMGIGTIELADTLSFIYENHESYSNIKKIIIDDAIINVEYDGNAFLKATSICAYGHEVKLRNARTLFGNINHYVHQTEDTFVINFNGEWGDVHIFTENDYVEVIPNSVDWNIDPYFYNVSFYNYEVDGSGRLIYYRRPYKYTMQGGMFNGMVEYCCGYEELWMEKGIVSIKNGKIVYTSEKQYTVKEGIEDFKGIYNYHTQVNYIPIEEHYEKYYREPLKKEFGIESLEELFEYNKAQYKSFT